MTVQSRRAAALEAATQSLVGIPIGFFVTFGIGSLHLAPARAAGAITAVMFLVSTLRGYVIRRRFARWQRGRRGIAVPGMEQIK